MKRNGGFTLVEVVVVVAIVALLSAIIVPVISKQIDEAKIGRAKNECMVIASAVNQFYRDVGVWPAASDAATHTDNALYSLVSGTAVSSITTATTALSYGYAANGNDNWYDGGQTAAADLVDIFDNHLAANKPEGTAGASYPTSGEFYWKGPYTPAVGMDPWGNAYVCNIRQAYTGTGVLCVVASAGPDGDWDTAKADATVPALAATPSGDDIWAVVTGRP